MNEIAISVRNITKDFRGDFWKRPVRVLEDVSFEVQTGKIFGLIGPNGAGKTTTIKILLGLIKPSTGQAEMFGHSVSEIAFKKQIGYLPENAYYYDFLKTEEIVDFYSRLFGLRGTERRHRTDELLKLVGLSDRRGVKLRNFSKGMLQRIGIAQALVNDPRLVILDEPMSGLDPIGRKEVRDIILRLADQGKTIMFSSHILSDVEALCEDVAIIVKGRVRAAGKLKDLVQAKLKDVEITFQGSSDFPSDFDGKAFMRQRRSGDRIILSVTDEALVAPVIQKGIAHGLRFISAVPHKDSLEDLFLEKVGSST